MKIRKIRKKPKAWLFPTAIERDYTNALVKLVDKVEKEAREFCKKWAETDRLRHDSLEDLLLKWLEELASALLFWVSDDEVSRLVRDFAHQTSDFNKRQFHKVLKSVYGVDIFKHEDWLDLQLKLFEKQNIALIKSIPTQLHEKLRYRFVEAVRKGERWENVADEIEKLLAIPKKRARLIARDQIGKLNGQLTKLRQEQVGITHYIWRTMLDERVRDSHQEREGKQFAWADAPEDGHPQQPILCRCYAEPVLPEFDDFVEGMDKPYSPISTLPSADDITDHKILPVVATRLLPEAKFEVVQLKRKCKHLVDLGYGAIRSNPKTWKLYQNVIIQHMNDIETIQYGTYRFPPNSKVYYNNRTRMAVVFDLDGNFLSSIVFTKQQKRQLENYLKNAFLR
ncbi:hypothetical protein GVX76_08120 [[Haemophilus] felis]|nr:hypothetical protein [[Haemophilus] felis]